MAVSATGEPVARVTAAHGQRGVVQLRDGSTRRYMLKGRRLKAVCGDWVNYEELPGSATVRVHAVVARRNALARPSPRDGSPEIIAANLTRLLVVCAPRPEADLALIDRYLCAAELLHCRPVLIWNKADIQSAPPPAFREYQALGYQVLRVCAKDGSRQEGLLALLAGELGAMVGQSGTGKSSLINALVPGATAVTGALSDATDEGRHTTTASVLYALEGAGALIDTPGVRDFTPLIPADQPVASGFVEMAALAGDCRFADCRHLEEPGCAVKAAVAAGTIAERRYRSFARLARLAEERRRAGWL